MNIHRLSLFTLLALVACTTGDDSSDDDAPTLEDRVAKLADCSPTDLEILLPWTGPAFDPMTGALLEPLPEGHVEAIVNGWRIRTDAAEALRVEQSMMVLGDLFTRDGFLGFEGFESDACDLSASHSLWRDEASMMAFVTGQAHATAISRSSEMHHVAAGAHWSGSMRAMAPDSREGIAHYVDAVLER